MTNELTSIWIDDQNQLDRRLDKRRLFCKLSDLIGRSDRSRKKRGEHRVIRCLRSGGEKQEVIRSFDQTYSDRNLFQINRASQFLSLSMERSEEDCFLTDSDHIFSASKKNAWRASCHWMPCSSILSLSLHRDLIKYRIREYQCDCSAEAMICQRLFFIGFNCWIAASVPSFISDVRSSRGQSIDRCFVCFVVVSIKIYSLMIYILLFVSHVGYLRAWIRVFSGRIRSRVEPRAL